MHAVKVDSRKIMAAGLVIVAVFAAVAITVNLFYLGQIQSLVRNTTTTSVMELATARARYLDECLTSDQNSVKSLAHFIADITPQEARDQVKDFISTTRPPPPGFAPRMAPPGVPQARPTCTIRPWKTSCSARPWPARPAPRRCTSATPASAASSSTLPS